MPLRAVAQDRDLLVGDQAEVGIVLVVHVRSHQAITPGRTGVAEPRYFAAQRRMGANQPRAVFTARNRVGWRLSLGRAMRPVRWSSTMPNGFTKSLNASSLVG